MSCFIIFADIGGMISRMDEYWGDDGEPPAWRKDMNIGVPIIK